MNDAQGNLDTEQLMSCTRRDLVDSIVSIQDSDGCVTPVQEVLELLTKIHKILDSAVSKWVGNIAHILAFLFNSASRQCLEVCALQYPFLHYFKDSVPPSEACFYGFINWSLA